MVELLRPRSGRNDECKNEPSAQVMRVIEALERENIESRPVWKPLHLQPVFREMGCAMFGGRVSERLFDHGLCLPSGTAMTNAEQERVIDVVRRVFAR